MKKLEASLERYHNEVITGSEVNEEMIRLAKHIWGTSNDMEVANLFGYIYTQSVT